MRDLTLAELDLAPSSLLLIKFIDDERYNRAYLSSPSISPVLTLLLTSPALAFALSDTDVPAPLDPSILALAEDFPAPPVYDSDPKKDEKDAKGNRSGIRSNLPFGSGKKKDGDDDGGERKYPKWFKLGPSEY